MGEVVEFPEKPKEMTQQDWTNHWAARAIKAESELRLSVRVFEECGTCHEGIRASSETQVIYCDWCTDGRVLRDGVVSWVDDGVHGYFVPAELMEAGDE